MATPNIVPRADSEGGLGTASKYWASAYIDTITTTGAITSGGNITLSSDGSNIFFRGGNTFIGELSNSGKLELRGGGSNTSSTVYINNSGSIGLGISSPIANLHVYENNSNVDATTGITVEQDGDGDAIFQYLITGVTRWVTGIDNNDADSFKIASSADLGSDTALTINTAGAATFTGEVEATSFNGIPFFSDVANNSMYTHDVSGTDVTAQFNTAYGFAAMDAITTGDSNVAVGYNAGSALTSGIKNILIGKDAGDSLTEGNFNIAIGTDALQTEDTHGKNIAIGHAALELLNAGADAYNVAVGFNSGKSVTTGTQSTIIGGLAGDALTTGGNSTLVGYAAGSAQTIASYNTAVGHAALAQNVAAQFNVAIGNNALYAMTAATSTDTYNVVVGHNAGLSVSTGIKNT